MPRRPLKTVGRRGRGKSLWERLPLRWRWAGGIALLAVLLLGNNGFRAMLANLFHVRRLTREVAAAREEELRLRAEIEAVKGDDLALESAARRELGYQRAGEIEYRFPPPQPED